MLKACPFLIPTPDMSNPRSANGNLRRKNRIRFKTMGCECGICHGKYGAIHYDEPSDPQHPLSFVIDEIKPVSKWQQFGYASARAAAEDWNNLQAAHYFCNAMKSDRVEGITTPQNAQKIIKKSISDGDW